MQVRPAAIAPCPPRSRTAPRSPPPRCACRSTALAPALDAARDGLGLPAGRLKAWLHKLLACPPGGFFRAHRDSERADDMVASLVVALPSKHRGGSLVVRHAGQTRRFVARDPAAPVLTLLSFRADCTHEVRPVTEGYRVVLSYELHFECRRGRRHRSGGRARGG